MLGKMGVRLRLRWIQYGQVVKARMGVGRGLR